MVGSTRAEFTNIPYTAESLIKDRTVGWISGDPVHFLKPADGTEKVKFTEKILFVFVQAVTEMNPLSDTLTPPMDMTITKDQMSSEKAEQTTGSIISQALNTRHEVDTFSGNTGLV